VNGLLSDLPTIALRLGGAALLGGIIGLERQWERKPAGLRTHMLVSIGCSLFMLVSIYAPRLLGSSLSDPTRIAAQIVTGIGFLGAGSIIQARGAVYGLTTAASIWTVAAIGMATGAGFYGGAVLGTFLAWVVLSLLDRWEAEIGRRSPFLTLTAHLSDGDLIPRLQVFVTERNVKVLESHVRRTQHGWAISYRGYFPAQVIQDAYDVFSGMAGVEEIGFGA